MTSPLDDFMVHTASVRTLQGSTGAGKAYAAAETVQVLVSEKRRLVRGADAREIVSEATIYDTDLAHASLYAPGSLVTLPSGREAELITVSNHTAPGLDLPEHLEVALT